ncbi:MAG: [LysW]-aminoadipate/[LysW]-glutamate kinase [Thaumarchaeota archaeon]|nr:[LysW]-aminoadipate/[LysW]-glutamate kinase [Nitrososphaerota archaeon]
MRLVIKIGGSLVKEGLPDSLLSDVKAATSSHEVVIVHGGGDIVTEIATRLGKEQRFVTSPDGIRSRYTDAETAEIYQMVMTGMVAKKLLRSLARNGVNAVSISGSDGRLLVGKRKQKLVIVDERGRKMMIDGGFTGRVDSVNGALAELLMKNGYVPLVSPVAIGEENEPLNIDGDRAAAAVAIGVGAYSVIFLTNVDGLTLDGVLVRNLSVEQAKQEIPKIGFGMQKKVIAGIEAVEGGVKEAIISSGMRPSPVQSALAHESCTVITR